MVLELLAALNTTLCADDSSGGSSSGGGGGSASSRLPAELTSAVLLQLDAAVDALQACTQLAAALQLTGSSSEGGGSGGSGTTSSGTTSSSTTSSGTTSSSEAVLQAGCLLAGAGRLALATRVDEAVRQLRGPRGHRSEGAKKAMAVLARAVQAQLDAACAVMEDADGLLLG